MIFLRITVRRWKAFFWWDAIPPVVVGVLVAIVPSKTLLFDRFASIMTVEASVMAAVMGVTVTALALVMGPMHIDILKVMDRRGDGIAEDFWPFWLTVVFAATTAIGGLLSLTLVETDAKSSSVFPARLAVGLVSFFFVWTLVSVVQLVSVVRRYIDLRILDAEEAEEATDNGRGQQPRP